MENRRILKQYAIANPVFAAVVFTLAGAILGLALHLLTVHYGKEDMGLFKKVDGTVLQFGYSSPNEEALNEHPTRIVLGFALTGTVLGLTASYCSYIRRRLKRRLLYYPSDVAGYSPVIHGVLAGAFLYGGASLVLSVTEMPFLSGWPKGTAFWVFFFHGFFCFGSGLLLDAIGISGAMITEMQHSKATAQVLMGTLWVPIASTVIGAVYGLIVTAYFRLRL